MHWDFRVLMIQDVCVEWRDQIQICYFVDLNETYWFNFIFMFQHSYQTDRVNRIFMMRIFSQKYFSFSASSRPLSPPNLLSVSLTTPSGYPKKRRSMCWPLSSSNPHVPPACLIYFSTMWYIYFVGMAAVTLDRTTMCYNWPITLASLIADVFFMRMGVAISLRDMFGDLIK